MAVVPISDIEGRPSPVLEPQNLLYKAREETKSKFLVSSSLQHHVHIQGDVKYASLATQLPERFSAKQFEESFWDDACQMLLKRKIFLKCRRVIDGTNQWILKWDTQRQDTNGTHYVSYQQAAGASAVIALLNEKFKAEDSWIPLIDEEDLSLRFPRLLVMYHCIRIEGQEWCESSERAYFEQVRISPNLFYNLVTYCFQTPPQATNEEQITNEDVLSKALAALYHHNLPLFKEHFATPSILPSFPTESPLAKLFDDMALKLSALDDSKW